MGGGAVRIILGGVLNNTPGMLGILTITLIVATRVDGDKNLLNLVEAELGSRLLRAYLVDNARDAKVLSRSPLSCLSWFFISVSFQDSGQPIWGYCKQTNDHNIKVTFLKILSPD